MQVNLENIKKSFGDFNVFENLSLKIEDNKITCITGPSGCGKTTILNMISGLIKVDSGNISGVNDRISYIFQENRLLPWKTAKENILFVLKDIMSEKEREEVTEQYLKMVGLYEFKDYYPSQLSGGMIQRVVLARAFAYPADLLLMDEPFKGLDRDLKNSIMLAFLDLWEKNKKTVILVTHDKDEALFLGDEVYVLSSPPTKVLDHIILNRNSLCHHRKKCPKNFFSKEDLHNLQLSRA